MFGNAFQEGLFHRLSRDRGEADWPVVPWIFLFALLEDRSDVCILPVIRTLPSAPLPLKVASKWCYPAPSLPMGASFQVSVKSGPHVSLLHWRCVFLALKLPFGFRDLQFLKAADPCPSSLGCLSHLVMGPCFPQFSCCYRHICRSLSYCTSHLLPHIWFHVGFGFLIPFLLA